MLLKTKIILYSLITLNTNPINIGITLEENKTIMTRYNKYRIDSQRMPHWNYSRNGKYFITFCVKNYKHIFGHVENNKMILSKFGKIANQQWHKSFEIRNELFLDEFIIMPNHIHAILILFHPNQKMNREIGLEWDAIGNGDGDNGDKKSHENGIGGIRGNGGDGGDVQTHGRASLRAENGAEFIPNSDFQLKRQPKSISSFIAGFKSACYTPFDDLIDDHNDNQYKYSDDSYLYNISRFPLDNSMKYKKYNRKNKIWQPGYHDNIIRDDQAYHNIKNYIINNPSKWDKDTFRAKH